ncbi:MAG TPA: S8 family serine peptidase [Gaiellaceae bacterium]|nr:S8 family serine peptidase [Gaiellaceae bacterium]
MLAISVPLAASAGKKHAQLSGHASLKRTWISPGLLKGATRHPNTYVRVIIQSTNGSLSPALSAFTHVNQFADDDRGGLDRRLSLINGVAATVRASALPRLMKLPNLIVTPDVPVKLSDYNSTQLWPYESGAYQTWSGLNALSSWSTPTIAVIDSGIQAWRSDFGYGNRVRANVNFTTLPNNSSGDGRGHGTFVAGIAAGSADGYAGTTPQANLVSLDVMDDTGVARTSDVIAACQWILANKARYNIRVANFSLHSSLKTNFFRDPLDRAVEKLWFSGVVVVAAAGNYGTGDTPSGVPYSPGNDPFVITVGAADLNGTLSRDDDVNAPWSAYGRTLDGFMKPDIAAPGRYMVGPVPSSSTLASERADKLVAPGYIELSGTSFSSPVVAGAAAQILAKHPTFTPDQVKGALMVSAAPLAAAAPDSVGVGELRIGRAWRVDTPPNPNRSLNAFVKPVLDDTVPAFDAVSWLDAATASVSWDSVSWADVSWADAAWNVVSWADVSWADVSWADVSWADVSWADVSWTDSSYEDAAEDDATKAASAYELTPAEAAQLMADPETAPDPATLPADIAADVAPAG